MIRRSKHSQNYTVLPNEIFKHLDDAIAIGLLSYLLSKPADWTVTKQQLYKHFKQGRKAIDNAFTLLEDSGYITGEQRMNDKGKFAGYSWTVFDIPDPLYISALTDSRLTDNGQPLKGQLLSNIKVSTIKQSKEDTNSIDFPALLSYLNKTLNKQHKVIPATVKKSYLARIKDGFTKKDIMVAIKNASLNEYHLTTTPKYKYLTPEFFSRADKLDMHLNSAPTKKSNKYVPTA